RFNRARMAGWDWQRLYPLEELLRAGDARLVRKGASREIAPLDLRDEPELAAVLTAVRDAYAAGQSLSDLADRAPAPGADAAHIDDMALHPRPKGANIATP